MAAKLSADEKATCDQLVERLDAAGKALSRLRAELGTALAAGNLIKAAWFAGAGLGRAQEVGQALASIGSLCGAKAREDFPE